MNERWTNLKDARGRKAAPLDPVELRLGRRHDVIEAKTLKSIAEDVGPGLDHWPRVVLIVGLIGVGLCFGILGVRFVQLVIETRRFPFDELAARLPIFIGITAALVVHWFIARQVRCGRVKKVMLAHRRCPHCGYNLRNLPADEEDGATVCPECGCAWRLEQ